MSIEITTDYAGQIDIFPRLVSINTTKTYDELLTANLSGVPVNGSSLNSTDLAKVNYYEDGKQKSAIFKISMTSGNISLIPQSLVPTGIVTATSNLTLPNPCPSYIQSFAGSDITLPPMNEPLSMPLGSVITVNNIDNELTCDVKLNDGTLVITLQPGQAVQLQAADNGDIGGEFLVLTISTIPFNLVQNFIGIWAAPQVTNYYAQLDGKQVTLNFPEVVAAVNAASVITLDGGLLPELYPIIPVTRVIQATDNSAKVIGVCSIAVNGTLTIGNGIGGGNFTNSGNGGFSAFSVTYQTA